MAATSSSGPTITRLDPSSVPQGYVGRLDVIGRGFDEGSFVFVAGTIPTYSRQKDELIVVYLDKDVTNTEGIKKVKVHDGGGTLSNEVDLLVESTDSLAGDRREALAEQHDFEERLAALRFATCEKPELSLIQVEIRDELTDVSLPRLLGGVSSVPATLRARTKTAGVCDLNQNATNQRAVAILQNRHRLAQIALQTASQIASNPNAFDLRELYARLLDHDEAPSSFGYYVCEPTFALVDGAYTAWARAFNAALTASGNAWIRVFENADRVRAELNQLGARVATTRTQFETLEVANPGVAGITQAHQDFSALQRRIADFGLITMQLNAEFGNRLLSREEYYEKVATTTDEERLVSAISELDRLRDEYAARSIRVPRPAEFTQTGSSTYFSFAQLNTGDYSWALLRPAMLQRVDQVAAAMLVAKFPIQLNSAYRNPARNDAAGGSRTSRHMFGDAVDLQVFDTDGDGRLKDDWSKLRDIVDYADPSYIEPISQSGPGHVHADWRAVGFRSTNDC